MQPLLAEPKGNVVITYRLRERNFEKSSLAEFGCDARSFAGDREGCVAWLGPGVVARSREIGWRSRVTAASGVYFNRHVFRSIWTLLLLLPRSIIRYSSFRYNERQLIDITAVRRVRPRAERWCDCEGHRRWKRAGSTLFCS